MIIRSIVQFLISLLPNIELPVQVLSAFANAANWVSIVNYYIPVGTFFLCIAVVFLCFVGCSILSGILQLL